MTTTTAPARYPTLRADLTAAAALVEYLGPDLTPDTIAVQGTTPAGMPTLLLYADDARDANAIRRTLGLVECERGSRLVLSHQWRSYEAPVYLPAIGATALIHLTHQHRLTLPEMVRAWFGR